MDDARHIQLRTDTGYYRYVRRVPNDVAHLDRRRFVKEKLRTKDEATALAKAKVIDATLEAYWTALLAGQSEEDAWKRHEAAMKIVQSLGFDYRGVSDILISGRDHVIDRLLVLTGRPDQRHLASAVLGTDAAPRPMLSGLFDLYMKHKGGELEGYSESQLRKHKQPKQRAAAYLLQVVGDKTLEDMDRQDAVKFRDWWIKKMVAEKLTRDAPNRSFTDIQGMLSIIDRALKTNFREIWGGLRVKEARKSKRRKRASYAADFVQKAILAPGALDSVSFQARMIFYGLIETGARPSEICNLLPEAIRPFDDVPVIIIAETDDRILKSGASTREIPLVGVSLWAFRQCPQGFSQYRDNEDSFSATINRALQRLHLRPTKQHTCYSIRHSFQDRILAAGATDRVQTDLMGHEFERPKYGEGSSIEQKLELLNRIKYQWPDDAIAFGRSASRQGGRPKTAAA